MLPVPLKVVTAGESHGPGLTTIVEGLPAGLELDQEAIDGDMARGEPRPAPGGGAARPHEGRPDRPPGRQPRLQELGRADEPVAGRGGRARGAPPASRPC